jgi:hypothetical protein
VLEGGPAWGDNVIRGRAAATWAVPAAALAPVTSAGHKAAAMTVAAITAVHRLIARRLLKIIARRARIGPRALMPSGAAAPVNGMSMRQDATPHPPCRQPLLIIMRRSRSRSAAGRMVRR